MRTPTDKAGGLTGNLPFGLIPVVIAPVIVVPSTTMIITVTPTPIVVIIVVAMTRAYVDAAWSNIYADV
jgi:hypothetical protein